MTLKFKIIDYYYITYLLPLEKSGKFYILL